MNKRLLLGLAILSLSTIGWAQGPNLGKQGGTLSSSYPFALSTYDWQYLYRPGDFNFGSLMAGNITKIYVRPTSSGSTTITNFMITLAQTTQTDINGTASPGNFITPETTVLTSGSYTLNFTAGTWLEIPLATPYPFDPSKSIAVHFYNGGYSGNALLVNYQTSPTNYLVRYNYVGSGLTGQGYGYGYWNDIGFFVTPASSSMPVALFYTPTNSCSMSAVNLLNNSIMSGYNISYQWTITPNTFSFINGTTSASKSPVVRFLDTIQYTIKLRSTNNIGSDSITKTISILPPSTTPTAEFYTPVRVIPRLNPPITYTDLSTNCPQVWAWSSPDYEAEFFYNPFLDSTVQNGQAFFAFSGVFDICLNVTNNLGSNNTCKQDYMTVMDAVQHCTDTISTSAGGFVTDEGGPGGNYSNNRSLCTTNPCPANSCKGILLDGCASAVTLSFTQIKLAGGAGDSIIVCNGTGPTSPRLIALGSGANGTFPSVTANSGKMFIYMISNGSGTDSGFTAKWVNTPATYGKPSAGFSIEQQKCMSQDTFSSGYPLQYINTTTGVDMKYTWDVNGDAFPDSVTKNPSTVLYNFTSFPERYTITLLAYNCKGIDTFYKIVTIMPVNAKPTQIDFIADKTSVSAADTISLTDLSCGATSWEWSFTPAINVRFVAGYNKNSQNPKIKLSGVGCIRVAMKAKNSAGEDSLIKTCYLKIRNYCQPASISAPVSDIGINKVTFAGINNITTSGTTAYTNYYDSAFAVGNAYKTVTYTLTIERNTNSNNINYKAWIDFNLDGDFDDAGEEVLTKLNQTGTSVSQSVLIPASAAVGSTLMRIGAAAGSSFLTSCATQLGEFEDYRININIDNLKPVITKLGADTIYIEQFTSYSDPGATAYDNIEGDITSKIIKSGNVDTAITGYFNICYDVKDAYGNAADTKCRVVVVVVDRTPPVITLLGKNPDTVLVGNTYVDPHATAFDNYSLNITGKIKKTSTVNKDSVGVYTITYTVTDFFGLSDEKVRTVYVIDNQKPVIDRNTTTTNHIHLVKMPFVDNGVVTVNDNYWKNIVPTRSGSVDVNVLGTYSICYDAVDGSGNIALQKCFSVEVKDTLAPTIAFAGADTLTLDVYTTYVEPVPAVSDNFYASNGITFSSNGSFDRNKIGTYVITYTATDNSNNTAVHYRVINIVDREKPVLTLKENNILVWPWGKSPYVDPGVQIVDNYYSEKSLESMLQATSTVNVFVQDAYTYTYNVTDSSGNVADPAVRTVIVTAGTGLNEVDGSGIVAYPNPARHTLNVYLGKLNTTENVTIKVMDMIGNVVLSETVSSSLINNTVSIDASDFRSGMYMIVVENGDVKASRKISIVK